MNDTPSWRPVQHGGAGQQAGEARRTPQRPADADGDDRVMDVPIVGSE